jgi:hypothetical protein
LARARPSRTVRGFGSELLEAAQEGRTVTYGRLMKRFRLSRGRAISAVLGEVDRAQRLAGAPGFAAIVVRKDTGYPGGGYFCDDGLPASLRRPASRCTDPRLSAQEKEHVRHQQRRIWEYYRSGTGGAAGVTT